VGRGHHVDRPAGVGDGTDLGGDVLVAEPPLVDQRPGARPGEVLRRAEPQRLARAHRRAHRLEPDAGAVVAHVALHHLVELGDVLGHAERAGQHAVRAPDAARLERRLDDAVLVLLDRVGWAHLGAGRVLAVHALHRRGLGGGGPVDLVQVDQRRAAVGAALFAGLHARLAPDATALV